MATVHHQTEDRVLLQGIRWETYVQHEALMRGKDELDLSVDPPPDLVVEVEVTRSAIDRMALYAALGVPEVWRYDGRQICVHQLQPEKILYKVAAQSRCFPWLPLARLQRFLDEADEMDQTTWIASFRAWVRDELAGRVE